MWTCEICGNINDNTSFKCLRCGNDKGAKPGRKQEKSDVAAVFTTVGISILFIVLMFTCTGSCKDDTKYDKQYWDAVKIEKALRDSGLDREADRVKKNRQDRLRRQY